VGGRGSGNKRGRPPKVLGAAGAAGEATQPREIGARLKVAIDAIVQKAATFREAAAEAGMDESSVYKAFKRSTVRRYFFEQLEPKKIRGRAVALDSLLYEAKEGKNAAAKVAACRALMEVDDNPRLERGPPGQAGLVVIIGSPGEQRQIPNPPREPVAITSPRAIATGNTLPVEREPVSSDDRGDWWRDATRRQ
jgi:hypothetical protein